MDVFLSTGERSGDAMAAGIARQLRRDLGGGVEIAGLVGPLAAAEGVANVFDNTDLAMVGVDATRMRAWARRLAALAHRLRRDPPKVFVGISHCTFNVALARYLPEQTYRIFAGPPEIWAWQVGRWGRIVERLMALAAWFRGDEFSLLHSGTVAAERATVPLKHYDELLCLLPMNYEIYRARALRYHWPAAVRLVGHPMATLRRTDDLTRRAAALRQDLGIPPDAHVLAVFPGSRGGTVDQLLDTMLGALVRILNRREDVYAVVSLADRRFETYVRDRIGKAIERLDRNGQLLASGQGASVLLTMASHAMLASGSITLQAACLRTPGTIAYTGHRYALVEALVDRGAYHGQKVPFGLPNIIRLWQGVRRKEDWPYEELIYGRFRPKALAESIAAKIPTAPYRAEAPPLLSASHEEAIRQALQAGAEEDPAVRSQPGPVRAAVAAVERQLRARD